MNSLFKMHSAGMYSLLAVALFILLVILLIPLLILGIAGAAFSRLGFSWVEAVAVILLMLAGSLVNIPLYMFRVQQPSGETAVFDAFTGEPVLDEQPTATLSLNLGGALIPFAVCLSLIYEFGRAGATSLVIPLAASLAFVTLVTFLLTTTLPVWGLKAPLFLPALTALACGFFLGGGTGLAAGVIAFVGGTMGVLAGATARGLVQGIGAGVRQISIGGAGMFGAVFLCAILAALVA